MWVTCRDLQHQDLEWRQYCGSSVGEPLLMQLPLTHTSAVAGQGGITAPGSIAATPVETPVDIEEGLSTEIPLVYFYGHSNADANPHLYKYLVERMAAVLDRRTQQNAKAGCLSLCSDADLYVSVWTFGDASSVLQVRADGMVINTMGWVDGLGYELLLHAIQALKAGVVLVVGQDRLHSQLRNTLRSVSLALTSAHLERCT